jgi:hypothetical protein
LIAKRTLGFESCLRVVVVHLILPTEEAQKAREAGQRERAKLVRLRLSSSYFPRVSFFWSTISKRHQYHGRIACTSLAVRHIMVGKWQEQHSANDQHGSRKSPGYEIRKQGKKSRDISPARVIQLATAGKFNGMAAPHLQLTCE